MEGIIVDESSTQKYLGTLLNTTKEMFELNASKLIQPKFFI